MFNLGKKLHDCNLCQAKGKPPVYNFMLVEFCIDVNSEIVNDTCNDTCK